MGQQGTVIEERDQFPATPEGLAEYWQVEMDAAYEPLKKWHERGDKVEKRFLGERDERAQGTQVNLFSANVQTQRAILFGKAPKVTARRRNADPNDDLARVGSELLQRLLNMDIERDSDGYAAALALALDERLLPGGGFVRLRYVAEFEPQPSVIDPVTGQELPQPDKKKSEDVEVDHQHWKDVRWSVARTWNEVRWVGFRVEMTKDGFKARFPNINIDEVPVITKMSRSEESNRDSVLEEDPWARIEVWEIWCKESRKVYWWVDGYGKILEVKDDPLQLPGFFPMPRPMFANLTTSRLVPTPDFTLAQDLYDEIDEVSSRITLLERAVAVRGIYDSSSSEIQQLLTDVPENALIPCANFDVVRERGGLKGMIDWLPLEQVANVLDKLREYRQELQALLYQVTGMSDIMRGQAVGGATATEQAIKAKFASVRTRAFQDEFARFATDTQRIKAQIIAKWFDPLTILTRANAKYMFGTDTQLALEAANLIKSDLAQFRIEVTSEAVALEDYAAVKQERSEFLMAVATFLQSSAPLSQQMPQLMPALLQMLQWSMAGFKGGSTIESVLDQAILMVKQSLAAPKPPPPPDPKMITEQLKQEGVKLKLGVDQQKAQMDMMSQKMDVQAQAQKHQMDLASMQMKLELDRRQLELDRERMEMDFAMQARQDARDEEAAVREEQEKPRE